MIGRQSRKMATIPSNWVSKMPAKVNSRWPHPRSLIALHSPKAYWKPDCECAFRRRARTEIAFGADQSVLCSPVCLGIIAEYGHYSRIFGVKRAESLGSSDCVAERERFEPSVPFVWSTKRRPVRNIQTILQHTRLLKRIASARKSGRAVPFHVPPKGERLAIIGRKVASFGSLLRPNWFARDCVPAAQSKTEKSLRGMLAKRQIND